MHPIIPKPSHLTLLLAAAASTMAACKSPQPGVTPLQAKLDATQARQLSAASASVDAAGTANQANPDGPPKTAVAGELGVARANLPPAQAEDSREALARVNAALTGDLKTAQAGWNEAVNRGATLSVQVAQLEQQVAAERATAAAQANTEFEKMCVLAAIAAASTLYLLAVGCAAAGSFLGLTRLYQVAAIFGAAGTLAWIAATQVGTARFNFMATVVGIAALGGLGWGVYIGYQDGAVVKTKASGFDNALAAVRGFAGEVATSAGTDAKKFWSYLATELDQAHKALVTDWADLKAKFAGKPAGQ